MNNLRKTLLLGVMSCCLASCGGQTTIPDSDGTTNPTSTSIKELSFVDFDGFDRELSDALSSGAEVTVTFSAPASIDHIPPRIANWMNTVQGASGKVEVEPQPKTRALFSMLLPLIPEAISWMKNKALYGPAENYNVSIPYNSSDGRIQKIIFRNKNSVDSESQTR